MREGDLDNNVLLDHLSISFASIEYLGFQLVCLVISVGLTFFAIRRCRGTYFSLSFWVLAGWIVVYLLPSIFLGGNFVAGLVNPWGFFLTVCGVPVCLAAWISFGPYKNLNISTSTNQPQEVGLFALLLLGLGAAMVITVWLNSIPFNCTAGWALMFDPGRALLAREVAGKFSQSPIVWRLIGAYVNVIVPLLVFFCGMKLTSLIGNKKVKAIGFRSYLGGGGIAVVIVIAYLSILLTGAKGNLLPSIMVCCVGAVLMPIKLAKKIYIVILVLALGGGSVVLVQQVILEGNSIQRYRLGECVASFGSCDEAKKLIETASVRELPTVLGSPHEARAVSQELEAVCGVSISLNPGYGGAVSGGVSGSESYGDSIYDVVYGLWERAFKIPLQVASWYYLWSSDSTVLGAKAVPLLSRTLGVGNSAEEVYQLYGSRYSKGDVTSTSTAPTSFLFAYPALMGIMGFGIAVGLLMLLDYCAAQVLKRIKPPLSYGFSGLAVVMAYHFLNTDFFTVLGSHGGGVFLAIFAFIAVSHRATEGQRWK